MKQIIIILFISILYNIDALENNGITINSNYRSELKKAAEIKFINAKDLYKDALYEQAIQAFKDYLILYPIGTNRGEVIDLLIDSLKKTEHYLEAVKYYNIFLKEEPLLETSLDKYLELAKFLVNIDYIKEANIIFNWFIKNYPDTKYSDYAQVELRLQKEMNKPKKN